MHPCLLRSRFVWDFVREQKGRLWLEFLPAYAPELNPVEYLWSHWKQHELPNFCPQTFWQLSHYARKALRRMRRRTTLVTGFWAQAELFERHYIMRSSIVRAPWTSQCAGAQNLYPAMVR